MSASVKNPLVTVVIPTFGRSETIGRAVASVLEQTYSNIEVIVVDDNPPESPERISTKQRLERWLRDPRLSLLEHTRNMGGAVARNTGLAAARGELIAFLDDDDIFLPTKVEREVAALFRIDPEEKKDFVLSEMEILYPDGRTKVTNRSALFFPRYSQLKAHLLRITGYGFVGTSALLFRTASLRRIGGFSDVKIRQEYALMLKLLCAEGSGIYLGEVLCQIFVSRDGITRKYSVEKLNELANIYQLQKKQFGALHFIERVRVYINFLVDVGKFLVVTKKLTSPSVWWHLISRKP